MIGDYLLCFIGTVVRAWTNGWMVATDSWSFIIDRTATALGIEENAVQIGAAGERKDASTRIVVVNQPLFFQAGSDFFELLFSLKGCQ